MKTKWHYQISVRYYSNLKNVDWARNQDGNPLQFKTYAAAREWCIQSKLSIKYSIDVLDSNGRVLALAVSKEWKPKDTN